MITNHSIIHPQHLARNAYVYLRQSSPGQVRKNKEGHQRQQAMLQLVAQHGWSTTRIILLDADTGQSGSSVHGRDDFQTLLDAIITGQAGLVAAREMSRLVRDNQDWSQLVRLCRYHDVLLADEHRLYDPANAQDRMVLGIQGAFNEFELSMILERMQLSLKQKAQRGEQYDALPPGYICRHACLCEKHPDERVQRAIAKVFDDFEHFPSVNQLYFQLIADGFQLPVVPHGSDWRDLKWVTPSYSQILYLVRNPAYAGIYVRGRTKVSVTLDSQGHKQTKTTRAPREHWDVFLENHHEPYISKETWERNMQKIAANANVHGDLTKGAVGRGQSLMAGILRCGRCGYRLHTRYPSQGVRYYCSAGERQRSGQENNCLNFHGTDLESALAAEILEVVRPAGIVAAQRASERLAAEHQQQRQLIVDRINALREAEVRAEREYKQTDVSYTSVRRVLGAQWESALARVEEQQSQLKAFDERLPVVPTDEQHAGLSRLGENVEQLWNDPRADWSLKQQLTRVLIQEIVANVDDQRDEVILVIQWSGGHHTELRGPRTRRRSRLSSSDLTKVIDTLRKVHTDAEIATVLNRASIRTVQGETWSSERVKRYRQQLKIEAFSTQKMQQSRWLTQAAAATQLKISPMSVHRLVRSGILPAEQPHFGLTLVIEGQNLELPEVQRAVNALQAGQNRPLPDNPQQLKLF